MKDVRQSANWWQSSRNVSKNQLGKGVGYTGDGTH